MPERTSAQLKRRVVKRSTTKVAHVSCTGNAKIESEFQHECSADFESFSNHDNSPNQLVQQSAPGQAHHFDVDAQTVHLAFCWSHVLCCPGSCCCFLHTCQNQFCHPFFTLCILGLAACFNSDSAIDLTPLCLLCHIVEAHKSQSSKLKAQSSKLKAQSSKLKAQSSKIKAQRSKINDQ